MAKLSYDIVIVGGGPNGLAAAAYLAKCGLSVCIVEERLEAGGGAENTEPVPGCRIDPHATYLYGAYAPGFDQLELHKFGFRMSYARNFGGVVNYDGTGTAAGLYNIEYTLEQIKKRSPKTAETFRYLYDNLFTPKNLGDFLRSIYWTPPPPVGMPMDKSDYPWSQVLKKLLPGLYDDVWNDFSGFELMDALWDWEPLTAALGLASWYNGPHPMWKGVGIQAFACNLLMLGSNGVPRGGMHSYMHALIRCAMFHGAKLITNCKVEEILVEDGEAKGVRLAETSPLGNKTIWANKAVIANTHIKQTFLDLVPRRHLDQDFTQKIKDINLNGGSLYVMHLVCKELPKYVGEQGEIIKGKNYPIALVGPCDSREYLVNQTIDVYSHRTHPVRKESMTFVIGQHDIIDPSRAGGDLFVVSPIYLQMPPPEYHKDGPNAVNKAKEEINHAILSTIREMAPNMTEDNIVRMFVNTPEDSSFRNLGFVGGNWYGTRHDRDQWWEKRPLPELSRYRTPIDKLYLCNQSSYPGGLCLMAVPYNLMHVLIEDGIAKPGDWWYPSPWYIPESEAKYSRSKVPA